MSAYEEITLVVSKGIIGFSVWISKLLSVRYSYPGVRPPIGSDQTEYIKYYTDKNNHHARFIDVIMDKLTFAAEEIVKKNDKKMFTTLLEDDNFKAHYGNFKIAFVRRLIGPMCSFDNTSDRYYLKFLFNMTPSLFNDFQTSLDSNFTVYYNFDRSKYLNQSDTARIILGNIINDALDSNNISFNIILNGLYRNSKGLEFLNNDSFIINVFIQKCFHNISFITSDSLNRMDKTNKLKLVCEAGKNPVEESNFRYIINSIDRDFLSKNCVAIVKNMKEPYISILSDYIENIVQPDIPINNKIRDMYNSLTRDERKEMLRLITNDCM